MKKKIIIINMVIALALFVAPLTVLGGDYTIGGRVVIKVEGLEAEILYETNIMLFSLPDVNIVAKTVPDENGRFVFDNLAPGEYLIQVIAPYHIVSKTRVVVGVGREEANQQLEIIPVRPIDPGMGSSVIGIQDLERLAEVLPASAGVNHAFGCVSISLVFVEWQGSNTWTQAQINTAMGAAQNAMNNFQAQAPDAAHITTFVENYDTFTVTNPVGCWCGDADLWVDEILQQEGYTTGSLDDRIAAFSNDRRDALCVADSLCGGCGANSSNYLFFITRDDCNLWGGWNCGNRYLISYWNRYTDAQVYVHEVGHGFGANDEYCIPGQNYCCGWVTDPLWGCNNIGGCLNQTNDNCDPACGADCGGGGPFVDCQDGCPVANCTTHTPCAMDGNTLNFCPTTRRQIGWVDSDGDEALDCLETLCGTDPGNPNSVPACLPPEADANGPYNEDCNGLTTSVQLDGSGSSDPDPTDTLTFMWSTDDCPGGTFSDPTSQTPILTVNTSPGCNVNCSVSLTVTDSVGNTDNDESTIAITDTQAPDLTCPIDTIIECDDPTDPSNTGQATATDSCDSSPDINYSDITNDPTPSCASDYVITRTWTAEDECGNVASCAQIITVEDATPPVIACNAPATIIPPDAPISFTATATDNCDESPIVEITGYDCFKFTKKGKRIDKTESCVVAIDGVTVTINDSGGVDDTITWDVRATDCTGNESTAICSVHVMNPAK